MAATEIVTAQDGDWADPTTWVGGVVPDWGLPVRLLHCVDVMMLMIPKGGYLTIDGADACLCAMGSVVVMSGGTLIGKAGGIYFNVPDDRLFVGNTKPGPNPADPDDHSDTDVGLWGMAGSTIKLSGDPVVSWLDALPGPMAPTHPDSYGCETIDVIWGGSALVNSTAAPQGWAVGDTLLLVALDGKHRTATCTKIQGAVVSYSGADDFTAPALRNGSAVEYPKMGNLTRRFVVASDHVVEGDTHHRAHVALMGAGTYQIDNVEFRNLGPREKVGRYAGPHFHKIGAGGAKCWAKGCSVWQTTSDPGNRFLAIHATNGVTLANNVCLKSQGHGIFLEDGTERNNAITGNLTVDVGAFEELAVVNQVTTNGKPATTPAQSVSSHYWLRQGNTISNNVAAGGLCQYGFTVLPSLVKPAILGPLVLTDCMGLGIGQKTSGWTFWTGCNDTALTRPVSLYASTAATRDPIAFIAPLPYGNPKNLTITDPVFLLNGTGTLEYISQLYLNLCQGVTVTGGVLAGKNAVHAHYNSQFTLKGVTVNCTNLMTPTYWEFTGLFDGCALTVAGQLFAGLYPLDPARPPRVFTIQNCTGTVGGRSVNGRFTHLKNTTAGPGVAELTGALRLN